MKQFPPYQETDREMPWEAEPLSRLPLASPAGGIRAKLSLLLLSCFSHGWGRLGGEGDRCGCRRSAFRRASDRGEGAPPRPRAQLKKYLTPKVVEKLVGSKVPAR